MTCVLSSLRGSQLKGEKEAFQITWSLSGSYGREKVDAADGG